MAEQKILISIQINDREAANTNKALRVTKDNFDKLTDAELKSIVADKEKILSAKALDKSLTQQAASQLALANATDKTRTTSGLNNAILMETSRLASDASYGFTAIANNLSQLINLFKASKDATGSFMTSIKSLFTAQSALLIGIQLLITYGDDLYRLFKELVNGSQLLKETFKDAGSEVQSTSGKFETYIRTLQDSNKSQEEQQKAINRLNKEFPEYIKQLDDAGVSLSDVANKTEKAVEQNDLYRESLVKLSLARAAQNKIDELTAEQINLKNEADLNAAETLERVNKLGFESIEAASDRLDALETEAEYTGEYWANYAAERSRLRMALENENREELKDLDDKIDQLVKYTIIENDERKKGGKTRERDFKQQLLDLSKLEESYRQKSIDQTLLTEDEKINLQEKFAKKELGIRLQQFKDRQKLRLDEFLESEASDAEKEQARKDYNESIELAEKEHNKVMVRLELSFDTKREKLTRKRAERNAEQVQKARDINRKAQQDSLKDLKTFDEETNSLYFEANANFIMSLMERQTAIINSEHSTIDQIASAQKEYFELQRQLRENDLNAEIAVIEAKKAVNLEYSGFAQSIGTILGNLAGENEALAKAALVVEKGAAIAKVIITAQTSIAARTASANAIPAFLPPFGTPNPAAFVAQAEAIKANTRTKIGAALSIATILSTAIGKKGGGAKDTGGGGGGRVIEAPDFNVVGASQTSQLAETVAGQQSKPVKAFVVGKDISTQQELDRNITNTASFG